MVREAEKRTARIVFAKQQLPRESSDGDGWSESAGDEDGSNAAVEDNDEAGSEESRGARSQNLHSEDR